MSLVGDVEVVKEFLNGNFLILLILVGSNSEQS